MNSANGSCGGRSSPSNKTEIKTSTGRQHESNMAKLDRNKKHKT